MGMNRGAISWGSGGFDRWFGVRPLRGQYKWIAGLVEWHLHKLLRHICCRLVSVDCPAGRRPSVEVDRMWPGSGLVKIETPGSIQ